MTEQWRPGFEHPAFQARRGRPPLPESRQLAFTVTVRFDEATWDTITKLADEQDITASEWLRRAALAALRPSEPEEGSERK